MEKDNLIEKSNILYELMSSLDDFQIGPVMNLSGNSLVEAGAGSGKTKVIVSRVLHMLLCGIPEENILMISFTSKAANEMSERLKISLGKEKLKLTCGTFHSVGFSVLRDYIHLLDGRSNDFYLMEEYESVRVLNDLIRDNGLDLKGKKVLDILSLSMNKLSRVSEICVNESVDYIKSIQFLGSEYMKYKKTNNCLDYDDILYLWYLLMKKFDFIKSEMQTKYKYILIDEYQDSNKLQDEIVKMIESGNLMLVGDVNQSIYGFRGAEIENIIDYKKRDDLNIYKLENNYRSVGRIVKVSNDIISNNKNRSDIKVKSTHLLGDKLNIFRCRDKYVEADYIVNDYIPNLLKDGNNLSDIAVLYRNHEMGSEIEKLISQSGLNFDFKKNQRLIDKFYIKDLLSYLKFLYNIKDTISLERVLESVKGVGVKTAEKILYSLSETGKLNVGEIGIKAKEMVDLKFLYDKHLNQLSSGDYVVKDLLEDYYLNHYRKFLDRKDSPDFYIKDIYEFLDNIELDISLEDFLNNILLSELDSESSLKEDKIFVGSIHSSKGLEFKHVILVGCNDGKLPSYTSFLNSSYMEEERRLFYVGLTRAKESVMISYVCREFRYGVGGEVDLDVSRFLLEIDENDYSHFDID